MKHSSAYIFALSALSNASPVPQFSFPSFSFPSFPLPTDGFPGGNGFSIPSFPIPTGGFPSEGSPFGIGSTLSIPSVPDDPSTPVTTPSEVGASAIVPSQAIATGSAAGGSTGASCSGASAGGGSSENGVTDNKCCTDVTVIFARGTGEIGNVGTVTGPPMFKSLRTKLGANKVTVQGVDYPASAAGNIDQGADGGPKMASLVKQALSQCPSTKVIISGYSQGAMVVHNALSAQGVSSSQIAGAVLFGDPLISQKVGDLASNKVKEFCASSDPICGRPTGDVSGSHLSYGSAADAAAAFVISAAGLSA